jgi:hypothetical protein
MNTAASTPAKRMKMIHVNYFVEVDEDATTEQIETMIDNAMVQFTDPADAEGEDADFSTGTTTVTWSEHPTR